MSRKSSPFLNLSLRIMGEKSSDLDLVRGRIVLLATLFMIFYLGVMVRLTDATVIQGYLNDEEQISQTASSTPAPQERSNYRADIVDRNGVLLATSLKTASLHADPKIILNPTETAAELVKIFPDMSYGDVLKKLQIPKRFVWIKRNMTPLEQRKVLEIGDPGLVFDYDYRRFYPQSNLFSHMIGYTSIDGTGQAGIERSFDKLLRTSHDPLKLTMDVRLQHILHREVQNAITDFTAIGGAGVIMDANSGAVLASVSLPDFDPHAPKNDIHAPEIFNRVTLGVYELGSTFKIFTTAALLDQKNTNLATQYDTSKPIRVGNHTIHDFHPEKRPLTIPEIFMVSSNIGTVHMAQDIGTDGLRKFYSDLGFFRKPEFEIDEVASPIIPSPWREINTMTASFGHGIAVTPLQLVSAASSVINGGLKVTPHLVENSADLNKPQTRTRIVSQETSLKMRQLLRLVVSHGTARKADIKGYEVGGKTGTAEKNIHGRYEGNKRIAVFIGSFPIYDPKYTIMVLVDEPHPNKSSYGYATAGWVAAPAVGKVVAAMGALTAMKPEHDAVDISDSLLQYVAEKSGEDH